MVSVFQEERERERERERETDEVIEESMKKLKHELSIIESFACVDRLLKHFTRVSVSCVRVLYK